MTTSGRTSRGLISVLALGGLLLAGANADAATDTVASGDTSSGTASNAPPTTDGGGTTGTAAADGEGLVFGVSFYDNKVIPLFVDMERGMLEAAEAVGATVEFSYANFDPAAQASQIEQFITRGMDAILVSPFDPNALRPAYEAVREANIPIISFANRIDEDTEDLFVGRDLSEMGELMMQAIADDLGGEGTVALISGPPDLTVAAQVATGWQTVLDQNPGLEVVSELVNPDMSKANGLDLANTLLASNPDVDAIACTIDQICLGAAQAADEQGISPDDIFIASQDADPEALEQVGAGTGIDWTLSQKGVTWGRQVIDVAVAYVNGDRPAETTIPNEFIVVDQDNVLTLTQEDLE